MKKTPFVTSEGREPVQRHIKQMTEVFNELAVIGAQQDEEDRVCSFTRQPSRVL